MQLEGSFGKVIGSEDCLYLNIWRPAASAANLPVYVYIHGGGNSTGAADALPDYEGWSVASHSGMVFVSFNYRLGPLGWFLDPAVQDRNDPASTSGNFGTLDIIQALKWVRDNITAFGGNPRCVTVAGESAGAMDTLALLLSPEASGLFQRAVVESGYQGFCTRERAGAAADDLFFSLLVKKGRAATLDEAKILASSMKPAERASLLRSTSAQDLVSLLKADATGMSGWPSIIRDGHVIPEEGFAAFSGKYANQVPLIIGSNLLETKFQMYFSKKPDWKSPLYETAAHYASLTWKASGVDEIADAISSDASASPVYVYRFDWGACKADGSSVLPGDWGRKVGAFHTMDVGFFLGTDSCLGPFLSSRIFSATNAKGRHALSEDIMNYLANFARTGNPNVSVVIDSSTSGKAGLPEWPQRPPHAALASESKSPVGLILDAGLDAASIGPLYDVVTKASVAAAIDAELDPETSREVRSLFVVK